ncbi:MAG TPA: hypothetical protein VE978_06010 [Chitinophagales bacterium]|nr:hypothetical protein [Chitinophagales bacterium]
MKFFFVKRGTKVTIHSQSGFHYFLFFDDDEGFSDELEDGEW